jgi:hypothetical protein
MIEWLEQNKEWFLSGAGILIISSIISFASIILTLWWKSHLEKKKIKKLSILNNIRKFSIPTLDNANDISSEHIKVSYKGNEYENLCMYNIELKNISHLAIENQKIHIVIPINSKIVEIFETKSLESIKIDKEEILNSEKKEIIYKIERLETNDTCTISYLLDIEDTSLINIEPRGVDNISYIYKDDINQFEIERTIIYIAMFIFVDTIPVLGSFIQAMIIIGSIPFIIDLIKKYKIFKLTNDNILNINGNVKIDKDGELYINQRTK